MAAEINGWKVPDLGEAAYLAFLRRLYQDRQGRPDPRRDPDGWETLSAKRRQAWQSAALAVAALVAPPERSTDR